MGGRPDYVGNYMLPDDSSQQELRMRLGGITASDYKSLAELGAGYFLMLIDDKVQQGSKTAISGRIIDLPCDKCVRPVFDEEGLDNIIQYSGIEAIFNGELGSDYIQFTKRYPKKLVDLGLVVGEISYKGKNVREGVFEGTYLMRESKDIEWSGRFILLKYIVVDESNIKTLRSTIGFLEQIFYRKGLEFPQITDIK